MSTLATRGMSNKLIDCNGSMRLFVCQVLDFVGFTLCLFA